MTYWFVETCQRSIPHEQYIWMFLKWNIYTKVYTKSITLCSTGKVTCTNPSHLTQTGCKINVRRTQLRLLWRRRKIKKGKCENYTMKMILMYIIAELLCETSDTFNNNDETIVWKWFKCALTQMLDIARAKLLFCLNSPWSGLIFTGCDIMGDIPL